MKKMNAFLKLMSFLLATALILTFKNSIVLTVLLLGLCLTAFIFYRTYFFERLKLLLFIGICIILFQLLFNQNLSVFARLYYGYLAGARICSASILIFIMMKILSPAEILLLLDFMPKKTQLIIGMTFSLIPAIINEEEYIALVQKSRPRKKHIFSGFTEMIAIIIPLMHRVLRRAETMALTIVSRGYI